MNLRTLFLLVALAPLLVCAQKKTVVQKILPGHAIVQYAGDIGFVSAGVGYKTKNKKFSGELLYGYVPESIGGITIHSLTGKITWFPLNRVYKGFSVDYFTAGVYLNYVFGDQYFAFSPSFYPYHYYGFATALHAGINVGQSINRGRLSLYYEFGTTDKELVSYFGNRKSLSFTDILNFSAGLRISLKPHS